MNLLSAAIAAVLCTPCAAQWSTASLSEARGQLAAVTVGPFAMFAGGRSAAGSSDVVDVWDSTTGLWSTLSLSAPAGEMVAASAAGRAHFSGQNGGNQADVFDASTGAWSTVTHWPEDRRASANTSTKVLFGGGGTYFNEEDYTTVRDTVSGSFVNFNLSAERLGLAATNVGELVLFAGGSYTGGLSPDHTDLVDVYDATTHTSTTDSLSQGRSFLAATTVGDKALFAGGIRVGLATGQSISTARVDIYDGGTGTWSQASLSEARYDMAATTAGRYAFFAGGAGIGGDNSNKSDRVDIYDSLTGSWSTATLSQARSRLTATGIGDRAFFAGGEVAPGVYSSVVDIFNDELGTAYCSPSEANSTGLPGRLWAEGVVAVGASDLTLFAEQLPPGQFGYFLTGLTQGLIQPPGSQGPICLSGNIGRHNRASEIIQGPAGSLQLDLASMPVNPPVAVLPGDTWNFQCWYRDANPATTSNTTNGVAVTFATSGDPAVQFAVTQASIVEQATQLEVLITLSQPANQDVALTYASGGTATVDVDWRVEEPNPFVIPAGQASGSMTLVVAEDSAQEPDEVAIVSLAAPVGAVLGTATTFTLTIVDDD